MAFDFNENLSLSTILLSKKSPSGKFSYEGQEVSYEALNKVLANNLREIAGTAQLWRENKNTVFSLLESTLSLVMPQNVMETFGMFAEIQTIGQGNKTTFTRKLSNLRAKQFVTRVAEAGRYEVFELGEEKFDIKTTAYGGAARIGFEEFLDGKVQWIDFLTIINEGMKEAVYKEIALALNSAIASFPATNKVATGSFDEGQFDRLLSTVSVYGSPIIYCTHEAAMTILPSSQWVSEAAKTELWQNGYFRSYKGTPVVVLPQSFTDETNALKVIDPSFFYIFPSNGTKPVKIVFEGTTQVKEFNREDWSSELQTYQKFGVGIETTNNLAVFRNTSLGMDNVPGDGYNTF